MINVKFSCGASVSVENGTTVYDAAAAAGIISREVLCATVDGEVKDLTTPLNADCDVTLHTFEDEEGKKTFWHTASHVLAQAVKRLYPETKLTIGPSVANGFYYDFDSELPFDAEMMTAIEGEMKKIVKENLKMERFTLPRDEAKKLMEEKDEPYKVLLIDRVPEGEDISFYKQGDFVDLCAGPHLFATGAIKAFKLLQCTGAYWDATVTTRCSSAFTVPLSPRKRCSMLTLRHLKKLKSATTTRLAVSLNTSPLWTM